MSTIHQRKLIAVDCDGTLFDDTGHPSQRTCDVFLRLVEAGHHIVAATGRSRFTACDRLVVVPGMREMVCANGAYAWDMIDKRLIWETEISPEMVVKIMARLRGAFSDIAFGWETRGGLNYDNTFVTLAGGIDEVEGGGQSGESWTHGVYKLKIRRSGELCSELQGEISTLLANIPCVITTSGAPFIEVTAPGSDKATGLDKTAAMLGFTAADAIVFGDNYNDLSMFDWAGYSVAMGNAPEAVKARANAVTLNNTEHGVAHYLEKLLDAGKL